MDNSSRVIGIVAGTFLGFLVLVMLSQHTELETSTLLSAPAIGLSLGCFYFSRTRSRRWGAICAVLGVTTMVTSLWIKNPVDQSWIDVAKDVVTSASGLAHTAAASLVGIVLGSGRNRPEDD